jgi:hypothetical protein
VQKRNAGAASLLAFCWTARRLWCIFDISIRVTRQRMQHCRRCLGMEADMRAHWMLLRLIVLLLAIPLAARAQAPAGPPMVHALLIGITDYDAKNGLSPLNGPENDVKLMRDVLTTRFGVPAANVRLVLNPTHSAIEQEFAALQQRVRPHDFVYIHYSGHGSTAPDPGDPRGEDQTWVPRGARAAGSAGKDAWDVLDKELALWLAPLYERTDDVVFVSDSCHSGTVSRGSRKGVRSADPVPDPHPLLASLPKVAAPAGGVRIGAARDFEPAVELVERTGRGCEGSKECYGVFTWNWAQALRESRPGEAWGDVFNRASARITTQPSVYQRPQSEGRLDRAVFAGRFAALTPTVEVLDAADGTVTLGGGVLAGLTAGSTYRSVVPQGATPAQLTVQGVDALTSTAQVNSGTVKRADLVQEVTHAYDAQPIKLYLGNGLAPGDAALVAKIRALLTRERTGRLTAFTLVPAAETADWLLQVARVPAGAPAPAPGAARHLPDAKPCAAPCAPPALWVVSRQGLLMDEHMRFDLARPDEEDERLVANLQAFARAQQVRRLAAQGNATPVRMTVTVWRPPAGDKRPCAAGAVDGSGWRRLGPYQADALPPEAQRNDCLAFELANTDTERTLYGYVVTVGPGLAITAALPANQAGSDEARMPPGARIRSDRQHLYRLDTPGRETLLLLASDGPVRAQALQQAGLRDKPQSRLEALLLASATGRGTVEAGGTWGAASIDVLVREP